MGFFERLKNGWDLGMQSLSIIKDNPTLIILPLLSSISMLFILMAMLTGSFAMFGFDIERVIHSAETLDGSGSEILGYVALFVYYLINFMIVIYFNVALVFCANKVFEGEKPSIRESLSFATSRLNVIVPWAILAATVGLILKIIENKSENFGKFVVGLVGGAWAIATFFVLPILAYENVGPIDALKRSIAIIKEKWGEALGANFGFGLFYFISFVLLVIPAFFVGSMIHPGVGVFLGIMSFFLIGIVISAAETVFLAAAYQHVNDRPIPQYQPELIDDIFRK